MSYDARDIATAANGYVRNELGKQGELGRVALQLIDLEQGSSRTLVKSSLSHDEVLSFGSARKSSLDKAVAWLADLIQAHLAVQRAAVVLIKEVRGKPWHAFVQENRTSIPSGVFGDEVIYCVTQADAPEKDGIEFLVRAGVASPGVSLIMMATLPEDNRTIGSSLRDDIFRDIVARTSTIAVSAYDGESFIVWSRTHQQQVAKQPVVPPENLIRDGKEPGRPASGSSEADVR